MNSNNSSSLESFLYAHSIEQRWAAARELMAAKELSKQVSDPGFVRAFLELGPWARDLNGLQRLLAIDLIVRISSFAKKLRTEAEGMLRDALSRELPSLGLAVETKDLPPEAKPAEIRENVAIAIRFAQGEWVEDYVVRSLAEEDRSQRCRIELVQQLAAIQRSVDVWLERLLDQPSLRGFYASNGPEAAAAQLREMCSALADTISQRRNSLSVSDRIGPLLARFATTVLQLTARSSLPQRLDLAAMELARLLDEILLAHLSLISESESYAAVEVINRWWQPLPFPKNVTEALAPIQEKIVAAIVLLARAGSRSSSLVLRLRQAIGDKSESDRRLVRIAEEEPSLPIDIHDWLRSKRRTASPIGENARVSLEAVASESFTEALANILLSLELAWREASRDGQSVQPDLHRAVQRARVEAVERGLEVAGQVGDIVDYSTSAHQTVDGTAPANPRVRIVRPMVIRKLSGGGTVAVIRALVTEVD